METQETHRKICITVDGKQIKVDGGLSILWALLKAGVHVPHLCYDIKRELRTGNCGKCTVELHERDGTRDVKACETPVEAGMVISINSPRLEHYRKGPKSIKPSADYFRS